MRTEHSCGFILYRINNGKNEYIIVKDRNNNYCFPKGHINEGESLIDCAYREVYEEIGIRNIKVDDSYKYDAEYIANNEYLKKITLFLGETNEKPYINDGEIKEIKYLEYEQAHELLTYTEYKRGLELANNNN